MTRARTPLREILPLTFSFLALLAASTGCSHATEAKPQGDKPAPAAAAPGSAPAASAAGTTAGAQPGAPGAPAAAEPPYDASKLPAVVAKIGTTEIKKEELLKEIKSVQARMTAQGQGGQAAGLPVMAYRQVLDGIVARTLLEAEAKAQGVTATDDEAKKQLEGVKGQFPNPEAFAKAIADQGLTETQLQENFKRQIGIQKYIQTKIQDTLKVTDEQTKAFYEENKQRMKQPERLHLRHILVKSDKGAAAADKEKAKAKADGLLARLKKGEDFAKLATENSDDPGSKTQGGDLSWVSRGDTVEPFEKAAFALTKKDEMTGVVESDFGFHIIQLLERQAETTIPFDQVKERIVEVLKQKQTQEAIQKKIEELKTKSKAETFLK